MREYRVPADRRREPTHPGEILREDVLPHLKLSVSEAARQLRVSRQALHRILAGTATVTPEMAVRLGKFCGHGPGLWLRMQQAHDLYYYRRKCARSAQISWSSFPQSSSGHPSPPPLDARFRGHDGTRTGSWVAGVSPR